MQFSRAHSLIFFSLFFILSAFSAPALLAQNSGAAQPAFAEKTKIRGIPDVGKVNSHLYRGSQPSERGIEELKRLGFTTIVDLRGERHNRIRKEKEKAESLGIHFVNIHASGWSPPTDEQLAQFFTLIRKRPREKIYFHCWLGDDRTGVFLATYRMAFEHWSAEDALREMDFFHFKKFWHPAMKKYVLDFPRHFAEAAAFAVFREPSAADGVH